MLASLRTGQSSVLFRWEIFYVSIVVLFGFSWEGFQLFFLKGEDLVVTVLGTELGKMRGFSILYDNGQVISTKPLASSPEVLWYTFFNLESFCKEKKKVDIQAMWHEREQAEGVTASYFLFLSTSVPPIQPFTFTFMVSTLEFNIFFGLFNFSLLLIYSLKVITLFCSFPFFQYLTKIWWGFRRK